MALGVPAKLRPDTVDVADHACAYAEGYVLNGERYRRDLRRLDCSASALHVRELLRHLAVAHSDHVDAAERAGGAVVVAPGVEPLHDAPVAGDDHVFAVEVRVG